MWPVGGVSIQSQGHRESALFTPLRCGSSDDDDDHSDRERESARETPRESHRRSSARGTHISCPVMAMAVTSAFSMAALNAALPSGVSSQSRSAGVSLHAATGVSVRRTASVVVRSMLTSTKAAGFQVFNGLRNENALQLRNGEFPSLWARSFGEFVLS